MKDKLFLVTGASGKLGSVFIQNLKKMGGNVVAFSRRKIGAKNIAARVVNLLDKRAVMLSLDTIDFSAYAEIYLIHAVGKFKFQEHVADISDRDGDGIDDEVYATNVLTLKNMLQCLLAYHPTGAPIKVCAFASVSDKHDIPFWESYTKSKNIVRGYLKDLCDSGRVQALVVNVSTVDTGNENNLRPKADKTYWLQPQEIVSKALPKLMDLSGYEEIDIIKEKPNFDPAYYLNHEAILKKWKGEMGKN